MANSPRIVLEDRNILGEICGVNDVNLRIIGDLLGARVLTRGNELHLDSNDTELKNLFAKLVAELERQVREGVVPGADLIRAIHRSATAGPDVSPAIRSNQIVLPTGIKVLPRSRKQSEYVKEMGLRDIVFAIGPAGTGKTYLAVAHALRAILNRKKRKLILTRPVVEAGENLGFLPGDLSQKISPYLRPLYDAMDSLVPMETIARLEESRVIEIAPLAYMRGRSLRDSYIILDEAQNTTKEQMKMFLTRLGEGSNVVVTGDVTQIDLKEKNQSGLLHASSILSSIPEIYFAFFSSEDVVRHPLVRKIVHAYENESGD